MIVTVVSMPEGVAARAAVSEARERLAACRFLLVDVEVPGDGRPDELTIARELGLEAEDLAWLGRAGETARAEFHGDNARFVVPVVDDGKVVHVHVFVTERYLVTVHRGPNTLVGRFVTRLPHERPADSTATLFLLLEDALETFRKTAVEALLQVEDL